ncbi:Methyltransferase corrinoid protein [Thermogutta terrifontis]|jgi:corrinoid protein of di/trimethylamine methyltransferase|uniref:Methyltransferase corrinoid protein n=1 Tax=Thermogutta terrifontis TaxID=1331910 RepID=A0A286RFB5_9BACT|nr:corrinoid protein [Thermogutta terrifontis]ASV74654.1 Methyltransferase corrinoid protein [Thermogutta terrifontis]
MSDYSKLYDAIVTGDHRTAVEVTKAALEANVDPSELISKYMIPAMNEVGQRFACNEYFVPELLIAARAMKAALELITPKLAETGAKRIGRVVIGTVKGDLHDIGKNLVASMLEGAGFEVVDLGVDVPPEKFVQAAQERPGTIVAMSALLTTTMLNMKNVIEALQQSGLRDKVRVMVGGAPITPQFAQQIGADGYGENATEAVDVARRLAAELGSVAATTG